LAKLSGLFYPEQPVITLTKIYQRIKKEFKQVNKDYIINKNKGMKKNKLYLDTSIPSAYFDFSKPVR